MADMKWYDVKYQGACPCAPLCPNMHLGVRASRYYGHYVGTICSLVQYPSYCHGCGLVFSVVWSFPWLVHYKVYSQVDFIWC